MIKANTDTNVLLEILGNESRRRILALLSKKPCYVSEISYLLKIAPKAVLEHLDKLEKAGIIRSFEDGRRRYYCIDKNLRIEITITPHMFETVVRVENEIHRVNYSVETREVMNKAKDVFSINVDKINMPELNDTLKRIGKIQRDISEIQGMINSRITEMFDRIVNEINKCISDEIERVTMIGIAKGAKTPLEISEIFGIPYKDVEKALRRLQEKGLVKSMNMGGKLVWKISSKFDIND